MPPAGGGLMRRRAFVGGLEDANAESGTAGEGVDGGVLPKARFPRTVVSWGDNSRRVKEEPSPSSSVEEEQQPQQAQQRQRGPQLQDQQERHGEQEHHRQQRQQQQDKTPRQKAGSRTGGWSTRICNEPGCSTVPSYGAPGTKRQFCLQHAKPGMINVASKKCGFPGEPCGKVATYGIPGGKRERCAVHAEKNMVDIFNRKCLVSGCHLRATFGDEGGKRERCAKHTESGMVNFNRRRCAARGCLEVASHGVHKGRKQMFCVDHADREMVSIGNKKCTHAGCTLAALHAPGGGSGPHEVCARHARDDAVGAKADKTATTTARKKRGPYRKRAHDNYPPPLAEPSRGAKRGRPAAATAAAAADAAGATPDTNFPGARKKKRNRVDEGRQERAAGAAGPSTSPPLSFAEAASKQQCPRSLRLLLQTDGDARCWTVLDWNWRSALVAAQPMPYV